MGKSVYKREPMDEAKPLFLTIYYLRGGDSTYKVGVLSIMGSVGGGL